MDEILASIRKIIADDPKGGYQPPVAVSTGEKEQDIIELTHPLPDDAPPVSQPPGGRVETPVGPSPREERPENTSSPLSRCVLDDLSKEPPSSPKQQAFGFGIGSSAEKTGNPVEELVRQLLQPLLKEWVEVHLPALVRWTINEQVERIIRQGVGQAIPTYEATRSEKK